MGMGTNILLLLFSINVFLYFGGYQSFASLAIFGIIDPETAASNPSSLWDLFFTGTAIIAGVAVVAVGIGIMLGNPWAIFATVCVALVGFIVTPLSFLAEPTMPVMIKVLLTGFFTIGYLLAILAFYRAFEP